MVRDKDTEAGIADAIIKVDDIDHHIRSGTVSQPLILILLCLYIAVIFSGTQMSFLSHLQLLTATTGGC